MQPPFKTSRACWSSTSENIPVYLTAYSTSKCRPNFQYRPNSKRQPPDRFQTTEVLQLARYFGYLSAYCAKPKRPLNEYFHCFSPSHRYQDCPLRRWQAPFTVAQKENEPEEMTKPHGKIQDLANTRSFPFVQPAYKPSAEINALQMVRFEFYWVGRTYFNLSFLDTWSPTNFVRFSEVPFGKCLIRM